MANSEKDAAIAEITDKFRESGAAVLTEYRGLTVNQLSQLRSSIREHATYAVVKNTLTERAAKEAGITASTASSRARPPSPSSTVTRSRRPRVCVTSPRQTPPS